MISTRQHVVTFSEEKAIGFHDLTYGYLDELTGTIKKSNDGRYFSTHRD